MARFTVMNVQPGTAAVAATTAPTPLVATPVTATAPVPPPRPTVVLGAVVGFFVAAVIAYFVWRALITDTAEEPYRYFRASSDYTALAGVLLAAAAIERLLEPFSRWLINKEPAETAAEEAAANAREQAANETVAAASVQAACQVAASTAATLQVRRNERAILHWAIASTVSLAVPLWMGMFLVRAVAADEVSGSPFVDMLFTALIIGAGTKPLHDLFTRLQAKKEDAENKAAATT